MSTSKVDNPSAFPHPGLPGSYQECGMTLRDWFAGQALAGIGAAWSRDGASPEDLAEFSYDLADAMLAARAQEQSA